LDLGRQGGLLARTLGVSLGAALVALGLGGVLAVLLSFRDLPARAVWAGIFLVPVLVPPYLWTLAWMRLGLPSQSSALAALVLGTCWFPLVTWPALLAVSRCPASQADAVRLARGEAALWPALLGRVALPFMLCGALAVFCLATVEYGVPSLLQVDTFAMEVFTLLNGYHDFTAAGRATLAPLVLVLGVAFLAARWLMPRLGPLLHPQGGASLRLHLPRGSHLSAFLLAMGLALGLVGLPLGVLFRDADRFPLALWEAGPDILTSLVACSLAAALALVLGAWLAAGRSLALAGMALVLLAWPPALLGLGWSVWFGGSLLLLPVGLAVRFLPLTLLLLLVAYRTVPASMDDVARMRRGTLGHRFVQMHWPVWWVGGSLVFALACGELTLGLLLAPPGHATLAVRLFNLNHYGQPDLVAALCLVQVAISLSPMLATSAMIALRENP